MRVIAGEARRLQLKTTPGFATRPTSDRIKETLFNIISNNIPGCRFLDLFAGSGGIGIEALSRGAVFCSFVDRDFSAVECIKENLSHTKLSEKALVVKADVLAGIRLLSTKKYRFDIVYVDPPYHLGLERKTIDGLKDFDLINKDSLIILEADISSGFDWFSESGFEVVREKLYKTNKHYFLKIH